MKNTRSSPVAVQKPTVCYFCPLADGVSPLADLVEDLQNIVVTLFCLRCGLAEVFENSSGWVWFCFLHALSWRSGSGAGIVDVVPVRVNDNYRGPLWFCSPFQRAASNSVSCTENAPHHDFITSVVFPDKSQGIVPLEDHRPYRLARTQILCLPVCRFFFRFCLFTSPSVSLRLPLCVPFGLYSEVEVER